MNTRCFYFCGLLVTVMFFGVHMTGHAQEKKIKNAYFAGGCFWCIEAAYDAYEGVIETISGYSGGKEENPSYKDVSSGKTSHRETVKVVYDENKITYQTLLNIFWRQIDPTDNEGQFVDRGTQYKTAVFYDGDEQKKRALQSKKDVIKSNIFSKKITTEILPFTRFYKAEEYHQNYYEKKPLEYKFYRYGSGRDQFRKKTWRDEADQSDEIPSKSEL